MIRGARVGGVHGMLLVFAALLVGRSAWVQLHETERWRALAARQHVASATVPAMRGTILDATNAVLVQSRPMVRLQVAPREVREPERLRDALVAAGVPARAVARALDRSRQWVTLPGVYLGSSLGTVVAMTGVYTTPVLERLPPASEGLRRLIGATNAAGQGVGGLEAALDSVLRGEAGRRAVVRDGKGARFASPQMQRQDAVPGHTVVLSLYSGLQDIADRALREAVQQLGASGGDIVILDPHTGEVRAMASRRAGAEATGATALTEPYEPGSTLKPFIAAALLERGRAGLYDSVPTYNGEYRLHGRTIRDVYRSQVMSFSEVMAKSSNVGIVQFAERLSPQEQYEALRDAGFGMVTGVPYPSESPGRLYPVASWSRQSPASLAMGYEISVTPLQLAAAYGAFANGGLLLEPQVVREVRGPDGSVVWRGERRVVRRMMREETARTMRALLRDVVTGGTGTSANLATFEVAGKSGTARRVSADGTGYESGAYTASFVGLFPADAPQYVIVVKLDNPSGAYFGGQIAAPLTKAVLEAAIAARDAGLSLQQLAAAPKRAQPSQAERVQTLRQTAEDEAKAAQTSAAYVVELGREVEAPRRVVTERPVPDVRGLSTRQAVHALHTAGFRVQLTRRGGDQLPSPGTLLRGGGIVKIPVAP